MRSGGCSRISDCVRDIGRVRGGNRIRRTIVCDDQIKGVCLAVVAGHFDVDLQVVGSNVRSCDRGGSRDCGAGESKDGWDCSYVSSILKGIGDGYVAGGLAARIVKGVVVVCEAFGDISGIRGSISARYRVAGALVNIESEGGSHSSAGVACDLAFDLNCVSSMLGSIGGVQFEAGVCC